MDKWGRLYYCYTGIVNLFEMLFVTYGTMNQNRVENYEFSFYCQIILQDLSVYEQWKKIPTDNSQFLTHWTHKCQSGMCVEISVPQTIPLLIRFHTRICTKAFWLGLRTILQHVHWWRQGVFQGSGMTFIAATTNPMGRSIPRHGDGVGLGMSLQGWEAT